MADDLNADVATVARIAAIDRMLNVVCRTTGMGFAAVARVTHDRWVACAVHDDIGFGLQPGGELKVETTICDAIRGSQEAVVIDNVAEDPTYSRHHTPALYGFQSYISVPIMLAGGAFFGTLCAIDPRPMSLRRPEIVDMFKLFADLVAHYFETERQRVATEIASARERRIASETLALSDAALVTELRTAELREQFIAVLGHDLRNPLASIEAGTRLLAREPLGEKAVGVLVLIRKAITRMTGLIDDVLDLARGRLGGGVSVDRRPDDGIGQIVEDVVAELRAIAPERRIELALSITRPIACDRARLAQLFSNLVANALTHGAEDGAVRVHASTDSACFEFSVANQGEPIPPAISTQLFKPFFRGTDRSSPQGLGLGLYISSEIARSHGGTLEVASNIEETRFTVRIPLDCSTEKL